jgi:hypothetical protein
VRRCALLVLVGSVGIASVPGVSWAQGTPLGPEFRVNTYTTNPQDNVAVARAYGTSAFVVVWSSYGQDGSSGGVFGQRYDFAGSPLGPEFRVNTYTTNTQRRPSVAIDVAGNFVVVWESAGQDGSSYGVFGQRYASSGAPLGPEFRVNTYTTLQQGDPSVAMREPTGDFVVVWNSNGPDGQDYGVFGQRYAASGGPTGTEFQINTYTTGYQAHPSVVFNGNEFMVVWTSYGQDGSSAGVFGQPFAGGGSPLGPEFRVNDFTTGHQGDASVAARLGGSFVVVWSSLGQDGSDRGVFGQRYFAGGSPQGSEFRINTYTTGYQGGAAVANDYDGNFVVVWSSDLQDGSSTAVFGQRYSEGFGSGVPDGPEFRVNTYTTGAQELPAVAADGGNLAVGGNFVVVWRSYGQDGSSHGVFGQRFDPIVLPVQLMDFRVE